MKRWVLWVTVLLVGAGIAAIVWLATADQAACCPPPGVTSPPADVIPPRPADAFPLTVSSVWDGDTIRATAQTTNAPVPSTEEIRIRLIGVDTSELSPDPQCWAVEARDELRALLPQGSTVWATPDADPLDRYDRWLFYLWTDDGRFVNYELVASGAAEAVLFEPNGAHFALLEDAEEWAYTWGAGRWGACGVARSGER